MTGTWTQASGRAQGTTGDVDPCVGGLRRVGSPGRLCHRLACVALVTVFGAACVTTRAAAPVERQTLEVPPPPPRVITPLPPPETPLLEPVAELPPATPNGNPPARQRPPRDRASNDATKPAEPKVEAPAPPVEPPPQPPAPAQTQAPQLRTPDTTNAAQVESQVRDTIGRTRGILDTTDYRPLSDHLKKEYDNAREFAKQAEEALKANNMVFAKELAEKAERLARGLQRR